MSPPAGRSAKWHTLLGDVELDPGELLLYLDPHGLDDVHSSDGEVANIDDRWQLRRLLEQRLHTLGPTDPPLLVHLRIADLRRPGELPFDAQNYPTRVLDVRLPIPALDDVRQLPPSAVELLTLNRSLPERLSAVARELTGLAWPPTPETGVTAVARLVLHLGPALRQLLAVTCPPGAATKILAADDPLVAVGELLAEWSTVGSGHPEDAALRAAAEDLGRLVRDRQVSVPVASLPPSLPRVLRDAIREVDAAPEVERLLEALPSTASSFESWTALGDEWARVRWALAALPPTPATADLALRVWERWAVIDVAWQTWLEANYAALLTRNVLRPASVHRVAPFLASQVVDAGSKVLLLVLDGLGVAQWQQATAELQIDPVDDRRVVACIPTMTTVSRQAIFAGGLPATFADTIDRTDVEPVRWRAFWTEHGLTPEQVHYARADGADAAGWQDPPAGAVVSGIAVNAVDDLMHGVTVNGDHQFHAGLTTWLRAGFLREALDWAERRSAQVWVTADHGNLPCIGLGETVRDEGVRVIGRGLRARIYATALQRDSSSLPGKSWTPPGFPTSAGAPLFAPGRTFFRRSGGVITHGGLSLDEAIVPLSRVL